MITKKHIKSSAMKVGGVELNFLGENILILKKDRGVLIKDAALLIILVLVIVLSGWFITAGKNIKMPNTFASLIIVLLLLGVLSVFVSNIIRMIKNASDYILKIEDETIFINKKFFCSRDNLFCVVIQASNGWDGIGVSYVIGLASTTSFYPLSFYQSLENSKAIADCLAEFLGSTVEIRKSKPFSLFKGY